MEQYNPSHEIFVLEQEGSEEDSKDISQDDSLNDVGHYRVVNIGTSSGTNTTGL